MPVSLWQWMPTCTPGNSQTAFCVTSPISVGNVPPFVSHRQSTSAPPRTAAASARNAYSGFALNPSKKCSASNTTYLSCCFIYATVLSIMERFSSKVVLITFSTWRSQHFPKMETAGVSASRRLLTLESSSGKMFLRRVLPNAQSCVCCCFSPLSLRKNSRSLGLEAGFPASM